MAHVDLKLACSNAQLLFSRIVQEPAPEWALAENAETQRLVHASYATAGPIVTNRLPLKRDLRALEASSRGVIDEHEGVRTGRLVFCLNIPTPTVFPIAAQTNRKLADRLFGFAYLNRHLQSRLSTITVDITDLLTIDPEDVRCKEAAEDGSELANATPIAQGFALPAHSQFLTTRSPEHKHEVLDAARPPSVAEMTHWSQFDRAPRTRVPCDRLTGNRMAVCALEERLRDAGVLDMQLDGVFSREIASGPSVRCVDIVVGGVVSVLTDKLVVNVGDVLYVTVRADAFRLDRLPLRVEAEQALRQPPLGDEATDAGAEAARKALALAEQTLCVRNWLERSRNDTHFTAQQHTEFVAARTALAAHRWLEPDASASSDADAVVALNGFHIELESSTQLFEHDDAAVAHVKRRRGVAEHNDSVQTAMARPTPKYVSERVVGAWKVGRVFEIDKLLHRCTVQLDVEWQNVDALCAKFRP